MAKFVQIAVIFIHLLHLIASASDDDDEPSTNNRKCSTLPQVQHRLNAVIVDCQNQVKEDMIRDALQQIRVAEIQQQQMQFQNPINEPEPMMQMINPAIAASREDIHWMVKRFKRDLGAVGLYDHPTVMSNDDKEIAGVSSP